MLGREGRKKESKFGKDREKLAKVYFYLRTPSQNTGCVDVKKKEEKKLINNSFTSHLSSIRDTGIPEMDSHSGGVIDALLRCCRWLVG